MLSVWCGVICVFQWDRYFPMWKRKLWWDLWSTSSRCARYRGRSTVELCLQQQPIILASTDWEVSAVQHRAEDTSCTCVGWDAHTTQFQIKTDNDGRRGWHSLTFLLTVGPESCAWAGDPESWTVNIALVRSLLYTSYGKKININCRDDVRDYMTVFKWPAAEKSVYNRKCKFLSNYSYVCLIIYCDSHVKLTQMLTLML